MRSLPALGAARSELECRVPESQSGLVVEDESLKISYPVSIPSGMNPEQVRAAHAAWDLILPKPAQSPAMRLLDPSLPRTKPADPNGPQPTTTLFADIAQLGLGIFLPTGCTAPPAPQAPVTKGPKQLKSGELLQEGDLNLRLDLAGDPALGQLVIIRQIHLPNAPDFSENTASQLIADIGRYQMQIFGFLQNLESKHVFEDGLTTDIPPGDRTELKVHIRQQLQEMGLAPAEGDSSERREAKVVLSAAILGGALLYTVTHPEVHLHRTLEDPEQAHVTEAMAYYWDKHGRNPEAVYQDPEFMVLAGPQREAWATREMLRFFREHPGQSAVLVFGFLHSICDDFVTAGLTPRIYSAWWNDSEHMNAQKIPAACP